MSTDFSCRHCGDALKGRTDKKFCDDNCRHAYHNKRALPENKFVRDVNVILRKNRLVLKKLLAANSSQVVSRDRMLQEGFHFRYHTERVSDSECHWYFCYEYGWRFCRQGIELTRNEKPSSMEEG